MDPPLEGALNMALDHAMAATLPPGCGALRFYRWAAPTLSLGRHEPTDDRWDPARLAAEGVDVVRRPTGGRAVLHDRELTYAIAVAGGGRGSMRGLYHAVNRGLVAAIRTLGVPAELAPRAGRAAAPDAGPCFAQPAEGEVVVGGRKLVGSAQVRVDGRLLQHGSILIDDDQRRLDELAGANGARCARTSTTSLRAWLDPVPECAELAVVFARAVAAELGGHWHRADTRPTLDADLVARLTARYRSVDWTWRR